MKKAVVTILGLTALFAACKPDRKALLTGEWKGEKFENPEMDSFFANSKRYIDTIGNNGNAATNMELYGTTNMDSARKVLMQQRDSTMMLQMNAIKNTRFTFMPDSLVVIAFDGKKDSGRWYFAADGHSLEMEETTGPGAGTKTHMNILTLTADSLKLKFEQDNTYSTVTFLKSK